ncbi:MAG: SseB family protein [Lachnospiraceae bacterium]|nr:SseB family protein [Lachnospiraceae bacterium]
MADDKIIDFAAKKAEGVGADRNSNGNSERSVVTVGLKPQEPKINVIRDGKVVQVNQDEVDPQSTVNVKNPEVDELIDKFTEEKTNENLTALINKLETARVLLPAKLFGENKVPIPLTVNTSEGEIIQPIFTDKEKMANAPKCEVIMNLPFVIVLATVIDKGPDIKGIGINPFGKAVILKRELLEKILENVQKKTAAMKSAQEALAKAEGAAPGASLPGVESEQIVNEDGTVSTRMKLTEEQYTVFERSRFEAGYLPKKLFKEGQAFIDALSEGREEYLDSLFEDSYAEKRMYPYLASEFKVMVMGVSETLDVVTITMPANDRAPGLAEFIYMAWNKETNTGRYFSIVNGTKKKSREVLEIVDGEKPKFLGEAPTEGTEINWLIEKLNEGSEA